MNKELERALDLPGCERLRDFVSVGPAQRAALELFVGALSAQEPVAWLASGVVYAEKAESLPAIACEDLRNDPASNWIPLGPINAAPHAQPAEQEPVAYVALDRWMSGEAWATDCFSERPIGDQTTPLYAAPLTQPSTVADVERELLRWKFDSNYTSEKAADLAERLCAMLSAAPKGSGHE